ncbi:3-hydroxyacyl-ACP dehydratase FabZ [Spirochaeta lutea]|uniref:3-hydroxyacyl-[acyl-carrier-protein] dehydratase n=1 Tax=Spirochaeta lutea TaxID=1480694 RepID=A0A098QY63_9SPIO|nr:3-hydroxyacyl-ACP dehydratase FabZ [Spirochaeta lutea]KGE71422.1 3-hydroxyacyl-ACP dehydratase [Spirochaeta lutea]
MKDIKELLPHREPFLFIDRLEKADQEEIIAYRTYTSREPFFQGHFPEYPVVPGVILVETMAQAGGAGVREMGILGENLFFLASVDKVKFRRQVRPDEEVRLVIKNLKISGRMLKQSGTAMVGDEVAAEAEWLCLVGPAPK